MKIDKVLVSSDDNPLYLDFWASCSRTWKDKMGIEPVLLYFGNQSPTEQHGKVVRIEPSKKYPLYLQTLWVRYWYPRTEPDNCFCVSDIDMYPLNRDYFTKMIKDWPQNFHGHLTSYSQPWPSCYHVGLGSTFQKLFSLPESFEDSLAELMAFSNKRALTPHPEFGFKDWGVDESYASHKLSENERNKTNVHLPYVPVAKLDRHPSARRLDRSNWNFREEDIARGMYLDCHSIRPYTDHKESIERVLAAIPEYKPQ